ncbi:hypothetical protein HDF26_002306 [Pedobacter cryoconitis]|uniref:hypothetical protein n=1 Tax=Pedobacter cryoconitis TaxID=188932 RepID=UPI00160E6A30|nr:hypothetical protein [Pedobacter cryoconitis]MBB6271849.1 hypothetical protein [Pedobacter cryoconitis]
MELEQNRAKALWKNWEKLENELHQFGGKTGDQDKEIARQKYNFLRKGLYRLSERPMDSEKPYVAMIGSVTAKLQKQLYPNRFLRTLHQAKALLYDRPKLLNGLSLQRAENLSGLKTGFERRGLEGIAKLLDHYLDYDKQQVSFSLIGKMDDLRTLSVAPMLKQDETGVFRLTEVDLKLRGSADPANDVSVSVPAEYLLNRQQMVNLVEQRPVYVFPEPGQQTDPWLVVNKGAGLGEFKLDVSESNLDQSLKKALYDLAEDTKIYKLTSAEVLLSMRLGNMFRLNAVHAQDKRFFVEAHPSGKELIIRNEVGQQITKDELLKSLRNPSGANKGFDLGKGKDKGKDQSQDQGLSM